MSTNTPELSPASSKNNMLNSWKEIAVYLDRGVRTVQRWEADLGLPIRRPRGKSRSAVIAMRADLDKWLQSCPLNVREDLQEDLSFAKRMSPNPTNDWEGPDLLMQSRLLRFRIQQSKLEFRQALNNLTATLHHMSAARAANETIEISEAADGAPKVA